MVQRRKGLEKIFNVNEINWENNEGVGGWMREEIWDKEGFYNKRGVWWELKIFWRNFKIFRGLMGGDLEGGFENGVESKNFYKWREN